MSNLYIYIKTPQVGNTNTLAHIIEHCVLSKNNLSAKDFFGICDIKGECYGGYTRYDIYAKINATDFIKKICKPLDKKIFKKELSAFTEETKNKIFIDIFREKAEKSLYGNTKKSNKKNHQRKEIYAYHKRRYKKNNIVVCNADYKIIENNLPTQTAGRWSLDIKKRITLSLCGEKNKVIILSYTHRKSQTLLYFMEFLYDTYMEYTERYLQGKYDSPISCMIETERYVGLAIPQHVKYNISPDFLDEAKNHFCNISINEYARKSEIINLLHIGQLPTDKEVKDFIQGIDMETVKKILT